jgi:hypothetical protein
MLGSIPAIIFWDLTASNVITYQTIHWSDINMMMVGLLV